MSEESRSFLELLPAEILLEICSFLQKSDLFSLVYSCKSLNEFITNNAHLGRRLPLILDGTQVCSQDLDEVTKSLNSYGRKYFAASLSYETFSKDYSMLLKSPHLVNLRILSLSEIDFHVQNFEHLYESFCALQFIEKLSFQNCDINDYVANNESNVKTANMEFLKTISFENSHVALLALLNTPSLNTLVVKEIFESQQLSLLVDFLKRQHKLERLALAHLKFESSQNEENESFSQMKFPLKVFEIDDVQNVFFNDGNFITFLLQFVDTMQEIHILNKPKYFACQDLFEILFTKYKGLSTLRVNPLRAPKDILFYTNLAPNYHVTELILDHYVENACTGIIKCLPNIRMLALNFGEERSNVLGCALNELPNLETLILNTITGSMVNRVRMSKLKTLKINYLPSVSPEDWKSIIKAFPNLEELVICEISNQNSLSDRMFNIITKQCRTLTHIKLGKGFVAIKRVFNQMLKNCKNLKTVEILSSAFVVEKERELVLNSFKKNGLRFIIHSSDSYDSVFKENKCSKLDSDSLTDSDIENSDNEWISDDDELTSDDDESFDDDPVRLLAIMAALMQHRLPGIDSDGEEEDGYFDSDGEWRPWEEDPDDYFF